MILPKSKPKVASNINNSYTNTQSNNTTNLNTNNNSKNSSHKQYQGLLGGEGGINSSTSDGNAVNTQNVQMAQLRNDELELSQEKMSNSAGDDVTASLLSDKDNYKNKKKGNDGSKCCCIVM